MIEEKNAGPYTVQPDEAAIIIKQDGNVEVFMPSDDEDDDGMISTESPSFRAMVIMTFIQNKELREQVTQQLVSEHLDE